MQAMIINSNHINQSFLATTSTATTSASLSAFRLSHADNSGGDGGTVMDSIALAAATSLDIDNLPLEQLLNSDWFHHNISQMLNISIDNLTSLLINAQQQQTAQDVDPPWLVLTLTIFYSLIFVAGVLGNLITGIVISRNKFMHTATNFYLFNLAVSDLILLLSGMPPELYNIWYPDEYPFNDLLCKMEGIFSETAANATVLTITAFTVERYIAICHPFRQHTMSKLSRAIKFIFAIWVTAFLLALPQAMQFSVVPQNEGLSCTMKNDFFVHVFAVSGFIFFGGPMTAICVLYVLIGVKLKRSRLLQAVPRRCFDVNRGISAQSRVIRMLIAVAVAFFLCWAPFHAQRLMAAYGITVGNTQELYNEIYYILNYISGVLYFLSTCINPLLYNIMSHKFREAFKVTLARHFGLKGKYQTQNHNYSALLRQNGSMRLHTTVNNNAFEHFNSFNSYRVVQLSKCRDPTHHLSLQDSIRTTTTTTTNSGVGTAGTGSIGGGQGGSSSCRSSHRNRCISIGSQSTLLSKNDVFNAATQRGSVGDHRVLQTQISQLSSVGDANSLLEVELGTHYHPHPHPNHRPSASSQRLKELRRALVANSSKTATAPITDPDCLSLDSQEWDGDDNNMEMSQRCSDNETEMITKPVAPVAPHIMAATIVATKPLHSVAELTVSQAPTRSRLKLSRIISRRDEDAFVTQATTSPRVELMRKHLPGMGHQQLQQSQQHIPLGRSVSSRRQNIDIFKLRKSAKLSLAERLRWRTKRMKPVSGSSSSAGDEILMGVNSIAAVKIVGSSKGERPVSSSVSSMASSGAGITGVPTTTTTLMRIAYPTTVTATATTPTIATVIESESVTKTNGGVPMAL